MQREEFENLIRKSLSDNFNLKVSTISKLRGFYDLNYKIITVSKVYFLKIYIKDSLPSILFQTQLIKLLKSKGLPVANIIATKEGKYYFRVGSNNGILQDFIPDKAFNDFKQSDYLLQNLGSQLAQTQLIFKLKKFQGKIWKKYPWDLAQFNLVNNNYNKIRNLFNSKLKIRLNEVFIEWNQSKPSFKKLTKQVCHNDFHGWNLLSNGKKITGILDFGDALSTWRVADLAITLSDVAFLSKSPIKSTKSVLKGYKQFGILSNTEKSLLMLLIKMRAVTMIVQIQYERPDKEETLKKAYDKAIDILNFLDNISNVKKLNKVIYAA